MDLGSDFSLHEATSMIYCNSFFAFWGVKEVVLIETPAENSSNKLTTSSMKVKVNDFLFESFYRKAESHND